MKLLSLLTILGSIFLSHASVFAGKDNYLKAIEGLDPMDLSEVDPKIAGILRKYYKHSFGDALAWESVESLRVEGELFLTDRTLRYVAYKKKPNSMKTVVHLDNGGRIVYAYDGEDAWQFNTLDRNAKPISMPGGDELNFIRDAFVGGYLIYPQVKGKQFDFLGTVLVEGDRVYELKTTLPDGQVIRSFFDMTSFAEKFQITVNNTTQEEELKIFSDFRKVDGMRIPFATTLKVEGKTIYRARTTDIKVNRGVMPWVFSRSHSSNSFDRPKVQDSNGSLVVKPSPDSVFSIQDTDIWSTSSGVVGSAFQIESADSGQGAEPPDVDDLEKESKGAED